MAAILGYSFFFLYMLGYPQNALTFFILQTYKPRITEINDQVSNVHFRGVLSYLMHIINISHHFVNALNSGA